MRETLDTALSRSDVRNVHVTIVENRSSRMEKNVIGSPATLRPEPRRSRAANRAPKEELMDSPSSTLVPGFDRASRNSVQFDDFSRRMVESKIHVT